MRSWDEYTTADSFKTLPSYTDQLPHPLSSFSTWQSSVDPFCSIWYGSLHFYKYYKFREFTRSLEKHHKTPPIHSYALAKSVYNPIKTNPSQFSSTRTKAAFLQSVCHPVAAHCQSTTASCRRLLRQSEAPRYREIVPVHEKPQELHRSVSCCWGRGWLAVPGCPAA